MKRVIAISLLLFTVFSIVSCGTESSLTKAITIPNLSGLDEQTAKTLLANKGLIPKIEYVYDKQNKVDKGLVIYTIPLSGNSANEDDIITVYVSKGYSTYKLSNAVGYMKNINNIDPFVWDSQTEDGKSGTKVFYDVIAKEGFLYIYMGLACKSKYKIKFMDFGTASINDTFDKTVPLTVVYSDENVPNDGTMTDFSVKIPLDDLSVQKPTNIYIKFDFWVGTERETFNAGFDLSW